MKQVMVALFDITYMLPWSDCMNPSGQDWAKFEMSGDQMIYYFFSYKMPDQAMRYFEYIRLNTVYKGIYSHIFGHIKQITRWGFREQASIILKHIFENYFEHYTGHNPSYFDDLETIGFFEEAKRWKKARADWQNSLKKQPKRKRT